MFLKMKVLDFDSWKFFSYRHRRPWKKVIKEVLVFSIYCIIFSILFAIIEQSMLGSENFVENFGNSFYYLITSITTIGYGDLSPKTFYGKLLFVCFICFYGVYKMVRIAEMSIKARQFKEELKKIGRLFMPQENHVVAFFDAQCLSRYSFLFLERFIKENLISNKFKDSHIVLVNSNEDYSDKLSLFLQENEYFDEKVSLINADIYEKEIFSKLNIMKVKQIYILGSVQSDMLSDSKVVDTVMRIRKHGYKGNNISAELIDDSIRETLREYDVYTVIRPTRSYPELIVRATVADGSERMLEELLSSEGDSIATFRIGQGKFRWSDALCALSSDNIGTLMAYIDSNGDVCSNPEGNSVISGACKLIVMINCLENKNYRDIEKSINDLVCKELMQ